MIFLLNRAKKILGSIGSITLPIIRDYQKIIHHFSTPKILSFRVQVRSISSYSWFSLSILKKKEE